MSRRATKSPVPDPLAGVVASDSVADVDSDDDDYAAARVLSSDGTPADAGDDQPPKASSDEDNAASKSTTNNSDDDNNSAKKPPAPGKFLWLTNMEWMALGTVVTLGVIPAVVVVGGASLAIYIAYQAGAWVYAYLAAAH